MADRNWVLNSIVPLGLAQEFEAPAAAATWTLNSIVPLGLAMTFATPAAEWSATYWGPFYIAFNAAQAGGGTNYSRTTADSVLLSDAALRYVRAYRADIESLNTQDAVARLTVLARGVAEALLAQDFAVRFMGDYRAPGDAASVTDSVTSTITLGGAVGVNYARTTVDAAAVADTTARGVELNRSVVDTTDAADAGTSQISGNAERILSDSVDVTDSAVSLVTPFAIAQVISGSRGGMFPNTLRHLRVVPDARPTGERRYRVQIRVALEPAQPVEMSLELVRRSNRLAAPIENEDDMIEEAMALLAMAA